MRLLALTAAWMFLSVSGASAAIWQPFTSLAPVAPIGSSIEGGNDARQSTVLIRHNPRGDVVVAWTRDDDIFSGGVDHIQLVFKPAGHDWLPLVEVGPPSSRLAALTLDDDGVVNVGYGEASDPAPRQASVVTRSKAGVWGAPQQFGVPAAGNAPGIAGLVTDAAGDLLVVYGDQANFGGFLESSFRPAHGTWSVPIDVEPRAPATSHGVLGLGMGENGVATLLEVIGTYPQVIASRHFTPAGGWQPSTILLSRPDNDVVNFGAFAVSRSGEAIYTLVLPDGRLVATSLASNATAWTPFATLGSPVPGINCRPVALAINAVGEAVVACAGGAFMGTNDSETYAAVRASSGTWGPLEQVSSNRNGSAQNEVLALTDDGRALLLVITDPIDDHTQSTALLERVPGQGWHPTAVPFDAPAGQAWFLMGAGPGPGWWPSGSWVSPPGSTRRTASTSPC